MKFEEFLMQPISENRSRRIALEEEVEELQERLNGELKINNVLSSALRGPILSCPCLSPSVSLPPKVKALLEELAIVEEQINWLETKTSKLKMGLYREKKLNSARDLKQSGKYHRKQLPCRLQNQPEPNESECLVGKVGHNRRKTMEEGRFSLSSSSDLQPCFSSKSEVNYWEKHAEENASGSLRTVRNRKNDTVAEVGSEEPNRLSEELLKCLISIFLKMNQISSENEDIITSTATKNSLSCINPKGFAPKTTFSCKVRPTFHNDNDNAPNLDTYAILLDSDGTRADVGTYQKFIQITRNSLKTVHFSESSHLTRKLRVLMQMLCYVNLTQLSYKQKLAFWINVYNACIMHAYLQHGLPSTQERMLTHLNKAAVNVGGIVLNALAIEHYILRHSSESDYDLEDKKDLLLRRAYGLHYPEPNITFALCRGNWSSPALRVYTPENVVNELGRAKVEYLETSVGVTSKKKIQVPKLLQWNMQDFADDMKSLIEWIYSQLPPNGALKRAIMECLNGNTKIATGRMIETVPYEYEFRYLLDR